MSPGFLRSALVAALALLPSVAWGQGKQNLTTIIQTAPTATLPLGVTDRILITQGGLTKAIVGGYPRAAVGVPGLAMCDGTTTTCAVDGTITAVGGGGSGDVAGPASAVNNNLASYNLTTGKIIKDSGIAAASVLISGGALGTPSSGVGTNLTALNATNITTGTLAAARMAAFGSGDVSFAAAGGAGTIANLAVTTGKINDDAVTNAKLADMAQATIKCRVTASTGNPEDCTATQATTILNAFVGDSGLGGTKGLVPGPAAGDAAATKFLRADGTWSIVPGTGPGGGDVTGPGLSVNNNLVCWDGVSGMLVKDCLIGSATVLVSGGALGTPSSATLTNAIGLPISTGVSGLASGIATFLTTPSSANLRSAVTDETGTGALYFQNGALGTPSSGSLVNATGLPISTGVSGLASGMATFLVTPSSANLRATLSDETGTGLAYFQGGDLGTPSAGVGTNLTGVPIGSAISGLAANIATFLAAPSSANLRAALTDETGTGLAYFQGGDLGTPSAGVGTALTALNGSNIASGTVAVARGGTGQTSYTDGQLLIGNSSGNTLTKATLTQGANVTITNGNGTITIAAVGAGLGDVSGPASAVDNRIAAFDGVTGKLIKDGGVLVSSVLVSGGALGTPSSGTATNLTGLPISTGVSGLAAGIASFLATPSSANLRTALTDETGSGAAYFQNGDLGTPSAGVATNITGINATNISAGTIAAARLPAFGSGDVSFASGGGAGTIANDAVSNAKLANMATATIKCRVTAGTGDPEDCTGTQTTTLLVNFVGDSGAGGTKGLAPAPAAGDTAAGKFLKANGTWAVPTSGGGDVVGPASAVNNNLASYDLTTGKLIKDSGIASTAVLVSGGALGTPSSGVGTNLTALNATNITSGTLAAARMAAFGSGDVSFAAAGGVGTIAAAAVTNAKLANMVASTIKCRVTASTGDPEDCTGTQATTLINAVVGDSGSGGTKGLAPAPAAGDAAAGKFLKADGSWTVPVGAGDVVGPNSAVNNNLASFNGITGKIVKDSGIVASTVLISGGALGTPASGTATNLTGLPVSTGISGLGTGVATFLATPSSANLAAAVTGETGSGALVFATSPALVTPSLGTPSAVNLTNALGLPLTSPGAVVGILPAANGGTNNAFFQVTGPATSTKTFTLPNASATLLYDGGPLGTPSSGVGTNLTALNATQLTSGTLPDARTSSNIAKLATEQNWTAGQAVTPTNGGSTGAATVTPNLALSNSVEYTLTGNISLANPTNAKAGQVFDIVLTQDGTGSRTIAVGANYKWAGGTVPTWSTGAGKRDEVTCRVGITTTFLSCSALIDVR